MFDLYFLDMMYVAFVKFFHFHDSNKLTAVRIVSASSAQKTFDSSEVMAVRLISASWFQKRLTRTF